jgi:hypothetical protein
VDIDVPAAAEDAVPERRLVDEAEALVHVLCPGVVLVHVEPDPLQAQLAEAEVEQGADRIGAVALGGVGRVADEDPEARAAVRQVERVEIDRPDGPVVLEPADHEEPAVAGVVVDHLLEPAFLHRLADRAPERQVLRGSGIGQPPDEERDVGPLARTKVDEPAVDERFGARRVGDFRRHDGSLAAP